MMKGWFRLGWLVVPGLLVVIGCDGKPRLHPVSGKATRKGAPVDNGGFLFVHESRPQKGLTFNALIDSSGQYQARTLEVATEGTRIHPGIPEGTYKVIYHPASDGQKTGLEIELPQTLTVPAGGTEIDLVVPDDLPKGLGQERDDAPPKSAADRPPVQKIEPAPKKEASSTPTSQESKSEVGKGR